MPSRTRGAGRVLQLATRPRRPNLWMSTARAGC